MKYSFPVLKMNERKSCLLARIFLIIIFYSLFTVLFCRQAWEYNGRYWSDLPYHIRFGIEGGDYSFLYFIIGFIWRLFGLYSPIALFESSLIVGAFLLSEWYIRKYLDIRDIWATWISAGAVFLCSIYIPVLYPYCYSWSLITQPWHNITYLGMRLFSIPVFFHTLQIIERYRERFTFKDWLCLAIPLLLGASVKPNFMSGYSFALLCVLIVDFLSDFIKKELKVLSFSRYIFLGSTVFPAVIVLFYQMYILYGTKNGISSDSGMTIIFLTSQIFSQGIIKMVIEIVRDIAFPLLVTVYGCKGISKKERFIWLLFLITFIQSVTLSETGPRAGDGNFIWGIYNAGYLVFIYMTPKFIRLVQMTPWKQKNLREKCFTLAGSSLLCAHLLSGIFYFLWILCGNIYYI